MNYLQNLKFLSLGVAILLVGAAPALAGKSVPVPLAALTGPYGLLAVGLVYGGYRAVKHFRK